ncbi:MAG TPA: hypothetical protein DCY13_13710 [Verrucomicrobiales bacterium]|nr:hypothetical protein [Verrucomicrobiales bacterium]
METVEHRFNWRKSALLAVPEGFVWRRWPGMPAGAFSVQRRASRVVRPASQEPMFVGNLPSLTRFYADQD